MRIGFLVETDHGDCAGHFINDIGATLEEAAWWIARYQLKRLPQETTLEQVTLYGNDHRPIYSLN